MSTEKKENTMSLSEVANNIIDDLKEDTNNAMDAVTDESNTKDYKPNLEQVHDTLKNGLSAVHKAGEAAVNDLRTAFDKFKDPDYFGTKHAEALDNVINARRNLATVQNANLLLDDDVDYAREEEADRQLKAAQAEFDKYAKQGSNEQKSWHKLADTIINAVGRFNAAVLSVFQKAFTYIKGAAKKEKELNYATTKAAFEIVSEGIRTAVSTFATVVQEGCEKLSRSMENLKSKKQEKKMQKAATLLGAQLVKTGVSSTIEETAKKQRDDANKDLKTQQEKRRKTRGIGLRGVK